MSRGDRDTASHPMRRTAERRLLFAAGGWCVLLGAATLFLYQPWLADGSYQLLASRSALGAGGAVTEMQGVVTVYGLALVVAGVVSGVIAYRLPSEPQRAVTWWVGACVLGAVLTRDVVGALLFVVCLVLYLARTRALRTAAAGAGR